MNIDAKTTTNAPDLKDKELNNSSIVNYGDTLLESKLIKATIISNGKVSIIKLQEIMVCVY